MPIEFESKVLEGVKKGTEIGFPTINLDSNEVPRDLEKGVYKVSLYIGEENYDGMMHFGPKTIGTEDKDRIYCEIHILNFEGDLYNKVVKVEVLKKIRDVRQFDSDDELKDQITKDIDA